MFQSFVVHEKKEFLKYSVLLGEAIDEVWFLKDCFVRGIKW